MVTVRWGVGQRGVVTVLRGCCKAFVVLCVLVRVGAVAGSAALTARSADCVLL